MPDPTPAPPTRSVRAASAFGALRLLVPLVVLVVGLVITYVAQHAEHREAVEESHRLFEERSVYVRDRLEDRLDDYQSLLLAGRALVTSSGRVTRREWVRLVRTIELTERLPEVYGLALIDRVPEGLLEEWLRARRADVAPDFGLRTPVGGGEHPPGTEHFVVRFHEPEARNREAWGLDVSLEGPNRVPYVESMESGELRMTPGLTLVQASGEHESGVVLALPFAEMRGRPDGPRPGWVAAPVSMDGLMAWLKEDAGGGVRVRIHETDPGDASGRRLLVDCAGEKPVEEWQHAWAEDVPLAFGGRDWSVEVIPGRPEVVTVDLSESHRIISYGVTLSVLLSMLVASITGTRDRAESIAAERTRSLRTSEARYRSLVDNAPVCIKELDRDGRILSMNEAGLELLGVSDLCDSVGHTMDEFVCPGDFGRVSGLMREAFDGRPSKFEFHCETPGRGRRLFSTTLDPIVEPNGSIRRLISVTSDVTDRARAIEGLRESESRYRSLVDGAPVCIKEMDLEGRITSINPEGLRIGKAETAEHLLGNRLQDLVIEDDRAMIEHELGRLRMGETRTFRYRFDRHDGERLTLETRMVPRACDTGAPCSVISVAMDVTERERNEERVLQLAEEARAASASKTAFLANMSHEIRTPMTAIIGFGEVLEETATGEQREAVQTIRQNGDHLLQIINDILDISKIESGRMTFGREAVDVRSLADGIDRLMRHRASGKGLALAFEVEDGAPESLLTDEVRLRQILINLVGNALKFTDEGRVTVRLGPGEGDGSLRVEVEDTGPGIEPSRAESVFEPFVQGDDSQTRRHGGTGLGLAISRQLATGLGGSLRLDGSYTDGARFVLELGGADSGGYTPEVREPIRVPMAFGVRRVLIAEDSPDNRRLIEHHLRRAGHEVECACDGHEALEKALDARSGGDPFDVILMDMQMPRLDGYEATRRLRASGYAGRIVALTAHAMSHERRRCMEAGCDEFETKPILRDHLLSVVAGAARRAA
ncbi:MAG: PAS domain S-box protein [Phycisphaerales bacterium JB040]